MTLEVGKVGTVTFTALVKGGFSDGSEINLSIGEYSLEWSTGSTGFENVLMDVKASVNEANKNNDDDNEVSNSGSGCNAVLGL